MTDQQRYDAVGYAQDWLHTPNLDKLAVESVNCLNTYAQSPQCQPSRASFLTGRYPTAHRVWWNETPLASSERTMFNYLQDAGYSTAYFGKIHITKAAADRSIALTRHFGIEYQFSFEDWTRLTNADRHFATVGQEFDSGMQSNGWIGSFSTAQRHHDEEITVRAIEHMGRIRSPSVVMVSFHGPHPPYAAPPPYDTLYAEHQFLPVRQAPQQPFTLSAAEWQQLRVNYYGCVSWLDANIGRLLAAVTPETIVIFTSDHGDILGDHGLFSKGMYAYEGNTRVPLLLRLPGVQPRAYSGLVQLIDVLPTLLDTVKIKLRPGIQGRSLLNGFRTGEAINEYVLSMVGYGQHRIRMLRREHWKYWYSHNGKQGPEYLFDLEQDATEMNNLARKNWKQLHGLRFGLLRALIDAEDPLPQPLS